MDNKIKDVLINILLFIVLVLLLLVPAYLCYKVFLVDTKANNEASQTENIGIQQENLVEEDIAKGPLYIELFPIIDDEQAYVVVPTNIDRSNPPYIDNIQPWFQCKCDSEYGGPIYERSP